MEYHGYIGQVKYDEEAEIFHGEVVNTRDVITFQGKNVLEIKQAFQDSVQDYLEYCAKLGQQPQVTRSAERGRLVAPHNTQREMEKTEKAT